MADSFRPSGSIQVVARSSTLIRTSINGYFDERVCNQFIELLDGWRGGRSGVSGFHDITGMDDYDIAARDKMSKYSRAQIPYFESVHMLVERRTVAWALDILIKVSGMRMTTYHSRAAFEAAYQRMAARGD